MTTTQQSQRDPGSFPTDTEGLDSAIPTAEVTLSDGERYHLRIGAVAGQIGADQVRLLAYNGSVPGPTIRVAQNSQLTVEIRNDGDDEATVHWHGLRLDNAYDGVPYETQLPIPIGGEYTGRLRFPDPGLYWYHPHIREDHGLEMGLYGAILVDPAEPDYWPPVDRDVVVTLDDILIEHGAVAPFSRTGPDHVAMGRYGNVMLTAGQTEWTATARAGEVIRFYLVNTANTRLFNVSLAGVPMKLVGGDSGRYEQETFTDAVLLAPSERAIVDVLFMEPGVFPLQHRTPERTYTLGTVQVTGGRSEPARTDFQTLRTAPEMTAERRRVEAHRSRPPDKTLRFTSQMPLLYAGEVPTATAWTCPMHPEIVRVEPGNCPLCGMHLVPADAGVIADIEAPTAAATWTCPMHPQIVSQQPGNCPICGMHLLPADAGAPAGNSSAHDSGHQQRVTDNEAPTAAATWTCPMHPQIVSQQPGNCPICGMHLVPGDAGVAANSLPTHDSGHHQGSDESGAGDGLEWEDLMPKINRASTPENMRWRLVDDATGAVNGGIRWRFRVGDQIKIRLVNDMDQDHPMHHPFHIHGAGRFLVLDRNGRPDPNLVWKDTVLLPAGGTVDLLLDVSNPGLWMAHCHIAEHNQSGMMFSFEVADRPEQSRS